jgi:hypothetical protein
MALIKEEMESLELQITNGDKIYIVMHLIETKNNSFKVQWENIIIVKYILSMKMVAIIF